MYRELRELNTKAISAGSDGLQGKIVKELACETPPPPSVWWSFFDALYKGTDNPNAVGKMVVMRLLRGFRIPWTVWVMRNMERLDRATKGTAAVYVSQRKSKRRHSTKGWAEIHNFISRVGETSWSDVFWAGWTLFSTTMQDFTHAQAIRKLTNDAYSGIPEELRDRFAFRKRSLYE